MAHDVPRQVRRGGPPPRAGRTKASDEVAQSSRRPTGWRHTDLDSTSFIHRRSLRPSRIDVARSPAASLGWPSGTTWQDLLHSRRVLMISEAGAGKTHECSEKARFLRCAGEPASTSTCLAWRPEVCETCSTTKRKRGLTPGLRLHEIRHLPTPTRRLFWAYSPQPDARYTLFSSPIQNASRSRVSWPSVRAGSKNPGPGI